MKTIRIQPDSTEIEYISKERLVEIQADSFNESFRFDGELGAVIRSWGELENHAIFLPTSFDYVLGKDKHGQTVLVPLKKDVDYGK